jgi:two-component system response regulator FixJ
VLGERATIIPLLLITAHGDIDMAVSAIKAGAFDFIEKPIDGRRLAGNVTKAVNQNREKLADDREMAALRNRYSGLSERQKQVVNFAVQGLSSKQIAARLCLSPRTVEHYRESAMERMHAASLAELVHMGVRLKILHAPIA